MRHAAVSWGLTIHLRAYYPIMTTRVVRQALPKQPQDAGSMEGLGLRSAGYTKFEVP